MDDVGAGRAIHHDAASAPPGQEIFQAKDEPATGALVRSLAALKLDDVRVVTSRGESMLYSRDQSEIPAFLKKMMFNSCPDLVVQAFTREAVSALLRFAASNHVTAIPRGSASSPFGGSMPVDGGMVVDVSAMNGIVSIDPLKEEARVEAGVRWADLDQELEKKGLTLNSSPSSKFSTVGGWVATGGIGLNSFSKGHLRSSVLSLELVTPDGSVMELSRLNPEFEAVFGSEGQLGVVTAVTLSVRAKPARTTPHLVQFDDVRSAFAFVSALAKSAVHPSHIVFESASKFALVNQMLGKAYFRVGDAVLINLESEVEEQTFQAFLRPVGLPEEKEYLARYMWNERFFPMKVRKLGPGMLGSEVRVPSELLAKAVEESMELCRVLDLKPLYEVHMLNDGHGLLLCYYLTDQGDQLAYGLDAVKSMLVTFSLVRMGCRPYSIGVLYHPFSEVEDRDRIERLRDAKRSLDPEGVMNSGKLFSLSGRFGGLGALVFHPRLMKPALGTMLRFLPVTSRVMRSLRSACAPSPSTAAPGTLKEVARLADECAMCGACVSVCPAYLVVHDERVTGRGKLMTAKAMARGERVSKEHSDRTFLCMRCKACEQVCQSKLELVAAYEVIEKELEQRHGRDKQEIERFVKYVESTPEYDKLIGRGLVLGAPKNGMGGGIGV